MKISGPGRNELEECYNVARHHVTNVVMTSAG